MEEISRAHAPQVSSLEIEQGKPFRPRRESLPPLEKAEANPLYKANKKTLRRAGKH